MGAQIKIDKKEKNGNGSDDTNCMFSIPINNTTHITANYLKGHWSQKKQTTAQKKMI